jgi:site-specific DNA recombinase
MVDKGPNQQIIRGAIYARVSSDQQTQQGTIDSQVVALRQRVQADGLTLEDEMCFLDDGYSGSTLVRPALERLRDVAWAGGFQRLYVHSPDRLARKYAWQVLLVEELQRSGVELVFLNRSIGISPEEDLLLQMQGMIAEYERAKIMERSRRGKRHAARRGSVNVLCGAPYGYRYVSKHIAGGQAHYQVIPEQARVIKQIFEWVGRDRMSLRQVCLRLRLQGIPSPKGKSIWDREVIGKQLKNPAYKGTAMFGRTRAVERRPRLRPRRGQPEQPRNAKSRYRGAPEDQIMIPVPAIVSAELFDAAAAQLAENLKHTRQRQRGPSYLLQGLLECSCCGYAYYGKGGPRFSANPAAPYPYYRCGGMDAFRFGGTRICRNKPVRLDRLEAAVWADVRAVLEHPEELRQEFERRLLGENETDIDLEQSNKQIAAVQRSISRLIDAYESALLDKSEFEPRVRQAKERLARLQQEASAASDRAAQRADLRLILSNLDKFVDQVRDGLNHAGWDTRREIIRSLVKTIKIEAEQIRITYRINPRPFDGGPARGQFRQHCDRRVHLIRAGLSFQGYYFPEDVVLLRDFPRIVGSKVFCREKESGKIEVLPPRRGNFDLADRRNG